MPWLAPRRRKAAGRDRQHPANFVTRQQHSLFRLGGCLRTRLRARAIPKNCSERTHIPANLVITLWAKLLPKSENRRNRPESRRPRKNVVVKQGSSCMNNLEALAGKTHVGMFRLRAKFGVGLGLQTRACHACHLLCAFTNLGSCQSVHIFCHISLQNG